MRRVKEIIVVECVNVCGEGNINMYIFLKSFFLFCIRVELTSSSFVYHMFCVYRFY